MQEEEAALLSMGAVLEWEDDTSPFSPDGSHYEISDFDKEKDQRYAVELNPERSALTAAYLYDVAALTKRWGAPPGDRKHEAGWHWYDTIAEAKAACEIHAATGQFPPGVEPGRMDGKHQAHGDRRDFQDG